MNIFSWFLEKRNLSVSSVTSTHLPRPIYSDWSLLKAIKEGYKANSYVYRSIYLKAKAGSSIPWYVSKDGEKLDGHHLTILFEKPNPYISRQRIFELMISWLECCGNSYLKKAIAGGRTQELWPISPARLHPVSSNDPEEWMKGYALDNSKTVNYLPEEIIHHMYLDPANPLLGVSPLQIVGKTVDVDNEQRDFNKATSQNRGVVDGVFTFNRKFNSQAEVDDLRERINSRHAKKRTFGVLGDDAKYIRTALSPAEMDFINSRKANREEIFITMGVPPIYAGVVDGATMNNYKTSELIFWFGTMLFLLDDLKDTFNFSFYDELGDGEEIVYDVSNVPAIREALLAKTKTAKVLFEMGVPFEQLNSIFRFGFDEFDGWEKSNPASAAKTTEGASITNDSSVRASNKLNAGKSMDGGHTPVEFRVSPEENEAKIEKAAAENRSIIKDLLKTQQEAVFDSIDDGKTSDSNIKGAIAKTTSTWVEKLTEIYVKEARSFGLKFSTEKRGIKESLQESITAYLKSEGIVLKEVSMIEATTVDKIIKHVQDGLLNGTTPSEMQQAIIDTGIFDEKRALMLSRTIVGTAANLGQWKGAALAGATKKRWMTAGFEVRDTHKKLDGVVVEIDEKFKVGKAKGLFPLDNDLPPGERVNCRCTLSYEI